ncbi:MAG: hypothetical protein KU37_04090 [Sulfuricurvum sp. PC08-66]|nr:MAG: hypothetical protein KU37_04090 [Sulfuricurvum sp. PC08-66]
MRRILFLLLLLSLEAFAGVVGKLTSFVGDVTITREGAVVPVALGMEIHEKDAVATGKRAKLQIILNDQTVITLGRDSVLEVASYLYEKGSTDAHAKLEYKQGFFKTITGQIGKVAPKEFEIKTKNSTIGIRGTRLENFINPRTNTEVHACTQGSTTFTDASGQTRVVGANQMVVNTPKGLGKVLPFTPAAKAKLNSGFAGAKKEEKSDQPKEQEKKKEEEKKSDDKKSESDKKTTDDKKQEDSGKQGNADKADEDKKSQEEQAPADDKKASEGDAPAQEGDAQPDEQGGDTPNAPDEQSTDAPADEQSGELPASDMPTTPDAPDVEAPDVDTPDIDFEDVDFGVDVDAISQTVSQETQQQATDQTTQEIVLDIVDSVEEEIKAAIDPVESVNFETIPSTTPTSIYSIDPL